MWGTIHTAVTYGNTVTPEDVVRLVEETGGITISNDWRIVSDGYMVALAGYEVKLNAFSKDDVSSYMETFSPGFMGIWVDSETSIIYFDTVAVLDDRDEAIKLGIENKQLAIWDDYKKEEIDLRSFLVTSSIRLGASVQESAQATIDELIGNQFAHLAPGGHHKPARADIQKMKNVYELYNKAFNTNDLLEQAADFDHKSPVWQAGDEWKEKYELSDLEKMMVASYKSRLGLAHQNSKEAFEDTVGTLMEQKDIDRNEAKKAVGAALKKYEQLHWGVLYQQISSVLDDMYRISTESYKLWPKMVTWIKEKYQDWLWHGNSVFDPASSIDMRSWLNLPHLRDIVREGGELLSKLRADHRIPQNFDAGQLSFDEFEKWLMDWKRENRQSEAQGQVVYEFHDKWTIQKLTTPEQLQYEGDEMGHCIGGESYASRVGSGHDIIYSLRDPKGVPHVTMQVFALEGKEGPGLSNQVYVHPDKHEPGEHYDPSGWGITDGKSQEQKKLKGEFEVIQIQGNSNLTPKPEYQRKIKEFLDSLRAKGWDFVRSDHWYPNDDDDLEDRDYSIEERDYERNRNWAQKLDDWYDDHYKLNHNDYRSKHDDPYGMPMAPTRLYVSPNWSEMLHDAMGSLLNEYDPGRFRGNWQSLAQAVYHGFCIAENQSDPKKLQTLKNLFMKDFERAEDQLSDWEHENRYYALEGAHGDIAKKIEAEFEAKGTWPQIKAEIETANPDWHDGDIIDYAREHDPDMVDEIVGEEVDEYYSGNARKFLNYLYQLVEKQGLVSPQDLPDPNERHGGLPSYEDIQAMPWPSEVDEPKLEIPGTFSHWHEAGARGNLPAGLQIEEVNNPRGEKIFVATADGRDIGSLIVDNSNQIHVKVDPDYQRMGVATAMLDMVYQTYPYLNVSHSDLISDQGLAWAQTTQNVPLPQPTLQMPGALAKVSHDGGWGITSAERYPGLYPILPQHPQIHWIDNPGREYGRPHQPEYGLPFLYHEPTDSVFIGSNPGFHYDLESAIHSQGIEPPGYLEHGRYNHLRHAPAYKFQWPNMPERTQNSISKAIIERYPNRQEFPKEPEDDGWDDLFDHHSKIANEVPPTVHWVNIRPTARVFGDPSDSDYGLPYIWHPESNSVWIGNGSYFHGDLRRNANPQIPGRGETGRYNHLRHKPAYSLIWQATPPIVQNAITSEIFKHHPEPTITPEPEAEQKADWSFLDV